MKSLLLGALSATYVSAGLCNFDFDTSKMKFTNGRAGWLSVTHDKEAGTTTIRPAKNSLNYHIDEHNKIAAAVPPQAGIDYTTCDFKNIRLGSKDSYVGFFNYASASSSPNDQVSRSMLTLLDKQNSFITSRVGVAPLGFLDSANSVWDNVNFDDYDQYTEEEKAQKQQTFQAISITSDVSTGDQKYLQNDKQFNYMSYKPGGITYLSFQFENLTDYIEIDNSDAGGSSSSGATIFMVVFILAIIACCVCAFMKWKNMRRDADKVYVIEDDAEYAPQNDNSRGGITINVETEVVVVESDDGGSTPSSKDDPGIQNDDNGSSSN